METCGVCGFQHAGSDSAAVGRFAPDGPSGYRSTLAPFAPIRATRAEAVADTCLWRSAHPKKEAL